jgi:hypothetical protein
MLVLQSKRIHQMRYPIFIVLLLICSAAAADWTPPESPDPNQILDEAREDACNGNHQDALLKHLWFHNNALKYRRALYGVRLSFALSDWYELGTAYPPARQALIETRDKAGDAVRKGVNFYETFHDYEAISEKLSEAKKTVELFHWLDTHHPERAKKVYPIAQPSLIHAQEYQLCGKYIDPADEYPRYVHQFKSMLEYAKRSRSPQKGDNFAYAKFSNDVSTLVALLVLNNRSAEAKQIAKQAMGEWEDEDFSAELADALQGKVPAPWP